MAVKTKSAPRRKKGGADARFENSLSLSGAEFHRLRNSSVQYYYTEFKIADLLGDLYAWMKDAGYSANDIRRIKTMGTDGLSVVAVYARCLRSGMPDYHEAHAEYWDSLDGTVGALRPVSDHIRETVDKVLHTVVQSAEPAEAEADNKPKKTIQDHMRDKALQISGDLEGMIDDFFDAECRNPEKFSVMDMLRINNMSPQMIDIVRAPFERMLAEMQEVQSGTDSQLNEAYAHLGKIQIRNFVKFLEQAVADCNNYVQVKKVERKPRAKKAVSPAKQVQRFKYLREFEELKLKSETPTKLIEASEAWLYNTKTRKLIHVVADDLAKTFTVKNSAIVGFDTVRSVQKTLRKPAEQLRLITGVGKPAARKNFADIRSTEIKFNGRGNEHTIILKVH